MPAINKSLIQTTLVYCEGECDKVFVQRILQAYRSERNLPGKFKVIAGRGGSATSLVDKASRKCFTYHYDRIIICCDSDWEKDDFQRAKTKVSELNKQKGQHVSMVNWQPICLEGLILKLLKCKIPSYCNSAEKCKQYLHKEYKPKATNDIQALNLLLQEKFKDKSLLRSPDLRPLLEALDLLNY